MPFQPSPCESCRASLSVAPALQAPYPLKRIRARWWLTGRSYRILLKWKNQPTSLLNSCLFQDNPQGTWRDHQQWAVQSADVIVPIPQAFSRSWALGHTPSLRIAKELARGTKLSILPLLQFN
ncbi:hypothetical protein EBZ37_08420, partial [bacterium]|nr:hypothetical protein [bacterium]